jgi:hypothetical protein
MQKVSLSLLPFNLLLFMLWSYSRVPVLDDAAWVTAANHPSLRRESCDVLVGHRNQVCDESCMPRNTYTYKRFSRGRHSYGRDKTIRS